MPSPNQGTLPKLRAGVLYGSPSCSQQRSMYLPWNVVSNVICNVLLVHVVVY